MYKISYEKCVCFIFLVILTILSCSGFRIDNLAMTDISKRNFHTSSSFSNWDEFDRILNVKNTQSVETVTPTYRHRLRHHRQLRAQAHHKFRNYETPKSPTGHIEAYVFPNVDDVTATMNPSEKFAQIPSIETHNPFPPTNPIITRLQRSSNHRRSRSRQQHHCYNEDVSMKAYKAKIVLRVIAESMSKRRDPKYSVRFKVVGQFKNSSLPIHDHIQLTFSNSSVNCEHDDLHGRSKNLVRTDIRTSQEYVLFLDASGANNYSAYGAPERIWRNQERNHYMFNTLKKVCNPNFTPRSTEIVQLENSSRRQQPHRLKLVCKARGLPIPRISWRRDGRTVLHSRHVRINYKKRKSTLVIKRMNAEDLGQYECVAQGVDGRSVAKTIAVRGPSPPTTTPPTPFRAPCKEGHRTEFCLNGGVCYEDPDPLERYCECPTGYRGKRCEEKTFNQPSMYPQTPTYTCKLGLSTRYFC